MTDVADSAGTTEVAWAASVAVVWLLVAFVTAVALVASGVLPAALSLGQTVSLLVAGGLLLALVAVFVGYFDPNSGRLF